MTAVSVVLVTRNREWCVTRAIESVLAQTHSDWELLIVDDGSIDGTRERLRQYAGVATLLHQPARGPYAARNLALRHAKSELVAFIDDDDVWLPHRLAAQLPLMELAHVGLVFGNARIAGSQRTTFDVTPPSRGCCAKALVWGNFVPTITVLARRDVLGSFCEESHLSADYLAWFRMAQTCEIDYVDDVVAEYSVHPGGISFDLTRALETRIQLFSAELDDADTAAPLLRQLLFNLGVHLLLVTARGRRGNPRVAARAMRAGWRYCWRWLPAFGLHHTRLRVHRLVRRVL
jgi:glycosyltransferase involved in cell wall biosynthesis